MAKDVLRAFSEPAVPVSRMFYAFRVVPVPRRIPQRVQYLMAKKDIFQAVADGIKEEVYRRGGLCPKCGNDWRWPEYILENSDRHDNDYMCEKCGHLWDKDDINIPNPFLKEEDI